MHWTFFCCTRLHSTDGSKVSTKKRRSNKVQPLRTAQLQQHETQPTRPVKTLLLSHYDQPTTLKHQSMRSIRSESDLTMPQQPGGKRNNSADSVLRSSKLQQQQQQQQKSAIKSTGSLNIRTAAERITKTLSPLLLHRRHSAVPPLTPQQRRVAESGQLRIWIGSWNVNGKIPPQDLSPLLERPKNHAGTSTVSCEQDYDVIAFGTQECARSIERSVVFPSKELWEQRLKQYLGEQYVLVASETLVALHIAVFVVRDLAKYVEGVQQGSVATGIGNVLGNKGGVGVGLSFGSSALTILFINSHFTAHQGKVTERNSDFDRICHEMPIKGFLGDSKKKKKNSTDNNKKYPSSNVTELFDCVFWCGDLNYRVNGTRKMVDNLLYNRMHEVLLANDQLRIEMQRQTVFRGFKEAEISFLPTYKYHVEKLIRKKQHQPPPRLRKSEGALVNISISLSATGKPPKSPKKKSPSTAANSSVGRSNTTGSSHATTRNNYTGESRKISGRKTSAMSVESSEERDDDDEEEEDDEDEDGYDVVNDVVNDVVKDDIAEKSQVEPSVAAVKRKSDSSVATRATVGSKSSSGSIAKRTPSQPLKGSNSTKTSNPTYDISSKQRIPSWTDRILWKDNKIVGVNSPLILGQSGVVKAEKYDCCMPMIMSDHKPVYAIFSVQVDWNKMTTARRSQRQSHTNKTADACAIL